MIKDKIKDMDNFAEGLEVVCISEDFPHIKKYGGAIDMENGHPKIGEVLVIDEVLGEFLRFDKYDTPNSHNWWHFARFTTHLDYYKTERKVEYLKNTCPFCGDEEQGVCRESANCLNVRAYN